MIILFQDNVKPMPKKWRAGPQAINRAPGSTAGNGGICPVVRTKGVSGRVNRRKAILQAAETLILERGLSGVTTRQISRDAGCSEGALYVHFHGRLELLL